MSVKTEFYYDFKGQKDQFIQVIRLKASHLFKVRMMSLNSPEEIEKYGLEFFFFKVAIFIDGKPPTKDDILSLDAYDYMMINEAITKQIEP